MSTKAQNVASVNHQLRDFVMPSPGQSMIMRSPAQVMGLDSLKKLPMGTMGNAMPAIKKPDQKLSQSTKNNLMSFLK